jgi:hypothetical protein
VEKTGQRRTNLLFVNFVLFVAYHIRHQDTKPRKINNKTIIWVFVTLGQFFSGLSGLGERGVQMKQSICKTKTLFFFIMAGFVFFTTPVPANATSGQKLSTAYNIWFEKPEKIWSINYKKGAIIPAGTQVRDVEITTINRRHKAIVFTTVKEKKAFCIYWIKKYHSGKTIQQFKKSLFTTKNFDELTLEMSEDEIAAIKKGEIVKGMNKKAVLVCYGPPPEHATFRQEHNVWTYWTSKFIRMKIYFGEDDRINSYKLGM